MSGNSLLPIEDMCYGHSTQIFSVRHFIVKELCNASHFCDMVFAIAIIVDYDGLHLLRNVGITKSCRYACLFTHFCSVTFFSICIHQSEANVDMNAA